MKSILILILLVPTITFSQEKCPSGTKENGVLTSTHIQDNKTGKWEKLIEPIKTPLCITLDGKKVVTSGGKIVAEIQEVKS